MDKNYKVVGTQLDQNIRNKIVNYEYVNFAKLIPRDRVAQEEEQRLQMYLKNGVPYYLPVTNNISIMSFSHWEQAFRVYSAIYTKVHKHRANELLQYGHIIQTVSLFYHWDNVYMYDKDFRIHMSEFPERSWGTILQLAWNLRSKDKGPRPTPYENQKEKARTGSREICRRFNKGRCSYGFCCKYEHRCQHCHKMGHGIHNCRRVENDRKDNKWDSKSPIKKKQNG